MVLSMTPAAIKQRKWRAENPEKAYESLQRWRTNNPEKFAAGLRRYRQSCSKSISQILRTRLCVALKGDYKAGSIVRDLGCTVAEFKAHIAKMFEPGMTWDNHGEWHLDHVRPLSSFDLSDRAQFVQAVHFSNYQPLWASENLRKGATWEQ